MEPTSTPDHTTGKPVIKTAKTANFCAVVRRVRPTISQTMITNETTENLKTAMPGTPYASITICAIGFISTPLKNRITRVMMMSSEARKTSQRYKLGNNTTARWPRRALGCENCSAATCMMARSLLLRSWGRGRVRLSSIASQVAPILRPFLPAHPSRPRHRLLRCGRQPAARLRQSIGGSWPPVGESRLDRVRPAAQGSLSAHP